MHAHQNTVYWHVRPRNCINFFWTSEYDLYMKRLKHLYLCVCVPYVCIGQQWCHFVRHSNKTDRSLLKSPIQHINRMSSEIWKYEYLNGEHTFAFGIYYWFGVLNLSVFRFRPWAIRFREAHELTMKRKQNIFVRHGNM